MSFEELRGHHFDEWGIAFDAPESAYVGFAERREGRLVAMGITYLAEDGRWMVHFARRDGSSIFVHRQMRRLARAMAAEKIKEVWATCDDTIPKARDWLVRAGFVEDGKEWRLKLAKDD